MVEKIIELVDIDPKIFFGTNNILVDSIRSYFPKLKIIARGNEIKAIGEEEEVERFEKKINELIDFFERHNRLQQEDFERLFPLIKMIKSKVQYAAGRKQRPIPAEFRDFLLNGINHIEDEKDFRACMLYFEAVVGFMYGKGMVSK